VKTKEQLETFALKAKFAQQHASDAMDLAQDRLADAVNRWTTLRAAELRAKRAADEWKESEAPIVLIIPFVRHSNTCADCTSESGSTDYDEQRY
jgi:hypothetical protein